MQNKISKNFPPSDYFITFKSINFHKLSNCTFISLLAITYPHYHFKVKLNQSENYIQRY